LIWNWRQSLQIGEFESKCLVPAEATTLVLALSEDWLAFASQVFPLTYFNRQRGESSETSYLRTAEVTSMAFSPGGASLVTGNRNGTIDLWDAWGKARQFRQSGHRGAVSNLAFTADGRLVSAETDGPLRIW
jgi:WD40 repeat protein